jgi:hypothetical protein
MIYFFRLIYPISVVSKLATTEFHPYTPDVQVVQQNILCDVI